MFLALSLFLLFISIFVQNLQFLMNKLQHTSKYLLAVLFSIIEVKSFSYSNSHITCQLCFHEIREAGVTKDLFYSLSSHTYFKYSSITRIHLVICASMC